MAVRPHSRPQAIHMLAVLNPQRWTSGCPQGDVPTVDHMTITFDITLRDGAVEQVVGADAYQQEQSMTTFFRTDGRHAVDCWAVRMASFRTDQILAIRRSEVAAAGGSGDVAVLRSA